VTLDAAAWFASRCNDDPAEQARDLEALLDCIEQCCNSSWWEWDDGSSLIFFRWPEVWRKEARDGARAFHIKDLSPRFSFPQVPIEEDWVRQKLVEKLLKLVDCRYITPGFVLIIIPCCWVPKGDEDI